MTCRCNSSQICWPGRRRAFQVLMLSRLPTSLSVNNAGFSYRPVLLLHWTRHISHLAHYSTCWIQKNLLEPEHLKVPEHQLPTGGSSSLASVSVPQVSCSYNVAHHQQSVNGLIRLEALLVCRKIKFYASTGRLPFNGYWTSWFWTLVDHRCLTALGQTLLVPRDAEPPDTCRKPMQLHR